MLKNGTRKDLEAQLKHMPPRWRVGYGDGRNEYVLTISEHYRLFVRYRNTKPKGWVVFVGYPTKAFINGTWDTVCARRKLLTQSFQTATAAAVAAQLHEGV